MLSFFKGKPQYVILEDEYRDEECKSGSSLSYRQVRLTNSWGNICFRLFTVTGLIFISAIVSVTYFASSPTPQVLSSTHGQIKACLTPPRRREWRVLTAPERTDYIQAVQCLSSKPSKLQLEGSLYDDFPWIHQMTAPQGHMSAPFLPWHRFFVHAYESALKTECGFQGQMPYWDWSQDWQDFEQSPIWSAESGFGGNGATDGQATVGDGRCVVDGPFAGLEARFFGSHEHTHCLSRGFAQGDELAGLASRIRPDELMDLIEHTDDFDVFASEIESRAHSFVKGSIKGDFSQFTGPYDPVFFLHHANLDRLWATWQQSKGTQRQLAYSGRKNNLTDTPASLDDWMHIGGLLHDVRVVDMMDTTEGILCYEY